MFYTLQECITNARECHRAFLRHSSYRFARLRDEWIILARECRIEDSLRKVSW